MVSSLCLIPLLRMIPIHRALKISWSNSHIMCAILASMIAAQSVVQQVSSFRAQRDRSFRRRKLFVYNVIDLHKMKSAIYMSTEWRSSSKINWFRSWRTEKSVLSTSSIACAGRQRHQHESKLWFLFDYENSVESSMLLVYLSFLAQCNWLPYWLMCCVRKRICQQRRFSVSQLDHLISRVCRLKVDQSGYILRNKQELRCLFRNCVYLQLISGLNDDSESWLLIRLSLF